MFENLQTGSHLKKNDCDFYESKYEKVQHEIYIYCNMESATSDYMKIFDVGAAYLKWKPFVLFTANSACVSFKLKQNGFVGNRRNF